MQLGVQGWTEGATSLLYKNRSRHFTRFSACFHLQCCVICVFANCKCYVQICDELSVDKYVHVAIQVTDQLLGADPTKGGQGCETLPPL